MTSIYLYMPKELTLDSPYAIKNANLIEDRNSSIGRLNIYALHDASIIEDIVSYINRYVENKPFVLVLYFDNKFIKPSCNHLYRHGFNLVKLSNPDRLLITSTKYNRTTISNDTVPNIYPYLSESYTDYLSNKLIESL